MRSEKRLWRVLAVLAPLAIAGCDAGAGGKTAGTVYASHVQEVLGCDGVCLIGGWYFVNVDAPVPHSGQHAANRAKAEATERVWYYITDPELYRRIFVDHESPPPGTQPPNGRRLRSAVVQSQLDTIGGTRRLRLTVAFQPL
ncbi:hypothetical protein MLD55_08400 [Alcanivorax sp. MM125-6]|nr:hypothetical protein [Alcanivorax sp. MM125-6]